MAQTPVIQRDYGALLNEAYAAQQALMTGSAAVEVHDQNLERVTYTPMNSGKLAGYIAWLEIMTGVRSKCSLRPRGTIF